MHKLKDVLLRAQQQGVAIGHFNVSDLVLVKAVFAAAQELALARDSAEIFHVRFSSRSGASASPMRSTPNAGLGPPG